MTSVMHTMFHTIKAQHNSGAKNTNQIIKGRTERKITETAESEIIQLKHKRIKVNEKKHIPVLSLKLLMFNGFNR